MHAQSATNDAAYCYRCSVVLIRDAVWGWPIKEPCNGLGGTRIHPGKGQLWGALCDKYFRRNSLTTCLSGLAVVTYESLGRVAAEERLARLARDGVEVVAERLVTTHAAHAVLLRVAADAGTAGRRRRHGGHLLPARQQLVGRDATAAEVAAGCGGWRRVGQVR